MTGWILEGGDPKADLRPLEDLVYSLLAATKELDQRRRVMEETREQLLEIAGDLARHPSQVRQELKDLSIGLRAWGPIILG
jgi:hypothetical protein